MPNIVWKGTYYSVVTKGKHTYVIYNMQTQMIEADERKLPSAITMARAMDAALDKILEEIVDGEDK